MSQWTKGKSKQQKPPPALFVHASPAASNVSLALAGEQSHGSNGGTAAPGTAGNSSHGGASGANLTVGSAGGGSSSGGNTAATTGSGATTAGSGMPSLLTLQRTTSRLRQEVTVGTGGSGDAAAADNAAARRSDAQSHQPSVGEAGGGRGGGGHATTPGGAAIAEGESTTGGAAATSGVRAAGAAFSLPLAPATLRHASSTRATDRTDALWAEMQATLEEVELSASEGTRVFGPDHDQKLAALRQAQIALAQAWARSEAEEGEVKGGEDDGRSAGDEDIGNDRDRGLSANNNNLLKAATATTATTLSGRDDAGGASAAGGPAKAGEGSAAPGGAGGSTTAVPGPGTAGPDHRLGARPDEEETQVDILLARKRREANDRYFERVSQGVLDVVAKLEDVAEAMRAVEQESKDIWGGGGDDGGSEQGQPPPPTPQQQQQTAKA